jgi:glycosyltransferase involved in cell wall biosynthesis
MKMSSEPILSVVVPVYNEAAGLSQLYDALVAVLGKLSLPYELIFVDDGSVDQSVQVVADLRQRDTRVKLVKLTRNFGKEIATTAGIHMARGKAIMTLDADGQHPVGRIPDFVAAWQGGAKVVVGIRTANQHEGFTKRYGSKLFYAFFNRFVGAKLVPGATDYRLIDQSVQRDFKQITERNRITRGLIDWLGYGPTYLSFAALPRTTGTAGYSFTKLVKLAVDSVVSLSISPLYVTAYIGAVVLPVSALLGLGMTLNALLRDPLHLRATGGAYVIVLILFLIGVLLVSQGIIGLYLSHIHTETQNRPLYIVDKEQSEGVVWSK